MSQWISTWLGRGTARVITLVEAVPRAVGADQIVQVAPQLTAALDEPADGARRYRRFEPIRSRYPRPVHDRKGTRRDRS